MDGAAVALIVTGSVIVFDVLLRLGALLYVPRNRRPQTALAWLLAIFLIPFWGVLLFLIVGNARLSKAHRTKQAEVNRLIHDTTAGFERDSGDDWPSWLKPVTELNRALGAMPLVGGNAVRLYPEDADALDAMVEAINGATRVVHVEFFILALDDTTAPFFDALVAAAERGVTVRVLVDHLGSSKYPGFKPGMARLEAAGIAWHLMLPFQPLKGRIQRPDLRNHRKLVVVDGTVGFTGSRNIIDPGYQRAKQKNDGLRWKDLMARFEGPVVAGIGALFVTDWYTETDEILTRDTTALESRSSTTGNSVDCQVIPSGPGFEGENNLRLFNRLVYAAQAKVILTSPYFVPDDSMLYAITTAAQSGLDVQLFVSEVGDQFLVYHAQRSYYETLLRAGVRIWLYAGPTILHAKHLTIDEEVSVIGSSNMDMRSFTLDLELSVLVRGGTFVHDMRAVEEGYRQHSRELTLQEWSGRGRLTRALDDLARLTSALQ
jgi:cardiolipin synthase